MKNLKIAIEEFKNLNILNTNLSFEEFSKYINSKKVILVTNNLLLELKCKINTRIFLTGWLLLIYYKDIFTSKIEIEDLILKKFIEVSKIIMNNDIINEEQIENLKNLICDYEKQFLLWKNFDKNKCLGEFINRYINVNKSLDLMQSTNINDREVIILELENQKNDIINLATKFDKNINKNFFEENYKINLTIDKISQQAYWDIIKKDLHQENFSLVYSNLEFIINTMSELFNNNDNIKKVFDINKIKEKLNNIDPEYFYILANSFYYQWKKLSSPIRDIDYEEYTKSLNNITNKNYHDAIITFIKNNYKIIELIYLDLLLLKINN
jgi:hypothetical protein